MFEPAPLLRKTRKRGLFSGQAADGKLCAPLCTRFTSKVLRHRR
jgi:hypothetical protein